MALHHIYLLVSRRRHETRWCPKSFFLCLAPVLVLDKEQAAMKL